MANGLARARANLVPLLALPPLFLRGPYLGRHGGFFPTGHREVIHLDSPGGVGGRPGRCSRSTTVPKPGFPSPSRTRRSGIPTTQRSTTLPQPSRIPSREPLTRLRATSGFEKFLGIGRDCALTGSGSIFGVFLIKVIFRTGGIPHLVTKPCAEMWSSPSPSASIAQGNIRKLKILAISTGPTASACWFGRKCPRAGSFPRNWWKHSRRSG